MSRGKFPLTVAALYVETDGCYFGLPGVDPWDEARDARLYDGPHPVVAHPPCPRWGKMWFGQPLWVKRTGQRKVKGDDDGCFEAALTSVRQWGGVIEHPWGSHAWPHFGLNVPPREGGWVNADFHGGWTCCVEQGRYGHYARKPTLLLVYGVSLADLESLVWGKSEARLDPAVVERMGLKRAKRLGEVGARGGGTDSSPRIHTPTPFRDLLLSIARKANSNSACPQRAESRRGPQTHTVVELPCASAAPINSARPHPQSAESQRGVSIELPHASLATVSEPVHVPQHDALHNGCKGEVSHGQEWHRSLANGEGIGG